MVRTPRHSKVSQAVRPRGSRPRAARLRWLVEFAQQVSGPRQAHAQRKLIGTLGGYLSEVVLCRQEGAERIARRGPQCSHLPFRGAEDQHSLGEKLALIRGTIHTLLIQQLSDGEKPPEARVWLRLTAHADGYVSTQHETDDIRDAVAYVVLVELGHFGPRVRRCAAHSCSRIFVRERRQRYCSVKCRNRATFQRWYRRHRNTARGRNRQGSPTARVLRARREARRGARA